MNHFTDLGNERKIFFNCIEYAKIIFNCNMIIHQHTLLSEDIFEKEFVCNLDKCKGACCVEGEYGAPITEKEIKTLEKDLKNILPFLSEKGRNAIEKNGIWEKDKYGDIVTTCMSSGECNFAVYDGKGILGCGIEKAFRAGKTKFQKPVSCHLYPIRITNVAEFEALNYHKWEVCKPACTLGKKLGVPVYKFLKEALIRKYGKEWYNELEEIAEALKEE